MAATTIAARVDELKRSAADDPDPRMAAFAPEQAALAQAPEPEGVAPVGTVLPDAELLPARARRPADRGEPTEAGRLADDEGET